MSIKGVEVNGRIGSVNWQALKEQQYSFTLIRASAGKTLDPWCRPYASGATAVGFGRGFYHTAVAPDGTIGHSLAEQIDLFLMAVGHLTGGESLWLDLDDMEMPNGRQEFLEGFALEVRRRTGIQLCVISETRPAGIWAWMETATPSLGDPAVSLTGCGVIPGAGAGVMNLLEYSGPDLHHWCLLGAPGRLPEAAGGQAPSRIGTQPVDRRVALGGPK